MLEDAGHHSVITSNKQLLDLVASTCPQVVLLNIDSDGAAGIELLWSLLAMESDDGPIVLLHTDLVNDVNSDLHRCVSAISTSDPSELFARIGAMLRYRKNEQALKVIAHQHADNTQQIDQQSQPPTEALSVFDAAGRFIFISNACEIIWGWTNQHMSAQGFFDQVRTSDNDPNSDAIRAIAANTCTSAATVHFDSCHRDQHGVMRHLRCRLDWSPVRQIFYCSARTASSAMRQAEQAIGYQLQTERVLRGLNRALRMLSACNQMLIRASSEVELLDEVCRIVRTIGGYQMAWVGFAIDDASNTVMPVARAGDEGRLLDDLTISWSAEIAEGFGPSGLTIRSGTPTAIADIGRAATFAPWAKIFTDAGLRSVVCLPLRDVKRTFGAFSLYSSDVRIVPDEEMALLQELADNVAFGIEARRVEVERRRLRSTVEKIAAAVSGTSTNNAGEFFRQMTLNMVDAVDAQAGFIARYDPTSSDTAQTIAAVCDGVSRDAFTCALQLAPFAHLRAELECVLVSDAPAILTHLLPSEYGAHQACVGRRLDNAAGQTVGMLFVLFREPLERIDYILSTLRIIGARVGAEMERQSTDLRLRDQAALLDYATDAIIVRDMDGMVTFWNKGAERLYGWTEAEARGRQMLSRIESETFDLHDILHNTTRDGEWRGELLQRRKDGNVLPVEARWTLIRDEHGTPLSIMAIETDISQRKSAETKIEHLAFYDLLTDLPNRSLLRDRLQHTLESNERTGRMGALLGIDLDNFKALNDTFGHDIGDLLLQLVAVRLSYCLRASDTVARVGGDEFVILLVDLSDSQHEAASRAKMVAEKILLSFADPFLLGEYETHSTPSIGITLFSNGRDSADELMRRADLAMYQAKASGRNRMQFFDTDMQAVITARTILESDMRTGIKSGQFLLYFQAQVDAAGLPTGAEALVRWQHPQRGLVTPQYFIPIAEETGLIIPLGNWVLEQACHTLASWASEAAFADLSLAVNVSARQLQQASFVDDVLDVLKRTGANPRRLKLELTESLLVESVDDTILKMTQLKARGVNFSLDDFGVGYSSLSYLKLLPLDQLKIDQSFVRDILTDTNDEAISRTIVALGNSLGLSVIAEGVETSEQKVRLAGLGCYFYQGYFFSRPVPLEEFMAFVRNPFKPVQSLPD